MKLRNDSRSPLASLAATLLAASFLLSCQQDAGFDANTPAPPVALAPRITVAPEDTAFFNRTEWVFVELKAGSMEDRAWVAFDSGRYVFKGVPANTSYTLSFDGYLDDKKTRVWSATRSDRTGTINVRAFLPAAMAPTPLIIQAGTSFTGSDKPFSTPQTIEIWTRGVDTVYYRQGEESPKVYAGGPLKLERSGDLYVWSRRNGETVASVSIPYQYIPGTTEKAANPTITPSGGTLHEADKIAIDVTAGVFDSIQYSIDSASWTRYRNPFPVGTAYTTGRIFARTIRGTDTSATTKASYLILAPQPVLAPDTTEFIDIARILIRASGADSVDFQSGGLPVQGRKADTITAVLTASGTLVVRSYKSGLTPDTLKRYIEITPSTLPPAAKPVFDAPNDTLDKPGLVGIHADEADYIKVWMDGASDTSAKTINGSDGTWMVSSAGRVYAKAYRNGFAPSVNWKTFVFRGPSAIRFTPELTRFTDSQTIVVESPNADTLFIRIGGRPEKAYPSSSIRILLDTTTRIDVRARRNGLEALAFQDITILPPAPLLEPARDTFEVLDTVKISSPRGDLVTYTLDGSKWDTVQGYFKLLQITKNETIRAKAWRGGTSSEVVGGRYTVIPRKPNFDITRDTFGLAIDITILAASPTDSIEYAIDGGSWTLAPAASKTLHIANTQTVSARAVKNGERSAVITQRYVIDRPVKPTVSFSLGVAGTGHTVWYRSLGCDSIQTLNSSDTTLWKTFRPDSGNPSRDSGFTAFNPNPDTIWVRAFKHGVVSQVTEFRFPYSDFGIPWSPSLLGRAAYFKDPRDGRSYRIAFIGNREWMMQNLTYKPSSATGLCFVNSPDSCEKYGRLYTWPEAMGLTYDYSSKTYVDTGKPYAGICPEGWQLPTASDFDTLIAIAAAIAGVDNTALALRSTTEWFGSSVGTDVVGFRGLPANYATELGFGGQGLGANSITGFWSRDQIDSSHARTLGIYTLDGKVKWTTSTMWPGMPTPTDYQNKKNSFSVRCIRSPKI